MIVKQKDDLLEQPDENLGNILKQNDKKLEQKDVRADPSTPPVEQQRDRLGLRCTPV